MRTMGLLGWGGSLLDVCSTVPSLGVFSLDCGALWSGICRERVQPSWIGLATGCYGRGAGAGRESQQLAGTFPKGRLWAVTLVEGCSQVESARRLNFDLGDSTNFKLSPARLGVGQPRSLHATCTHTMLVFPRELLGVIRHHIQRNCRWSLSSATTSQWPH